MTALVLWPLYYRFFINYISRPATDVFEVGESVSSRLVSFYSYIGILKSDDEDEETKGFWLAVRDFLVEKKWKNILKEPEELPIPALRRKCRRL